MVTFLDTVSFLSSVQTALDRIIMASVDGEALRSKPVVSSWRKSLAETQIRLAPLQSSITGLSKLLGVECPSKEMQEYFDQIAQKIQETITMVERTQSTIRQELSILESQQQLEEAANITKLTELAFIFVPLSFVTSAFSMQIKELEGLVPLYVVFIAGVVALGLAYATRLAVRSSIMVNAYRTFRGTVRGIVDVPEDSPTPTRAFIKGILFLLPQYAVPLYSIPMLCMVMLVSLWVTRTGLDLVFKSLVTVVVLVWTLATVVTVPVGRNSRLITWMQRIACSDWLVGSLGSGTGSHTQAAGQDSIALETGNRSDIVSA